MRLPNLKACALPLLYCLVPALMLRLVEEPCGDADGLPLVMGAGPLMGAIAFWACGKLTQGQPASPKAAQVFRHAEVLLWIAVLGMVWLPEVPSWAIVLSMLGAWQQFLLLRFVAMQNRRRIEE